MDDPAAFVNLKDRRLAGRVTLLRSFDPRKGAPMAISMHDFSVATFTRMLKNLSGFLDKAAAHAAAKKFDSKILVNARLAPDMLPLSGQIRIACDFAKGCSARLAGMEVPKREDNETTLEELKARVAWTLDFIASIGPQKLAGSDDRTIVQELRNHTLKLPGLQYLSGFVLPNFFFHVTTAYAILRHNGVELGKQDFIGSI
jgi:hypothetical protein